MSSKSEVRASLLKEAQLLPQSGHVPLHVLDAGAAAPTASPAAYAGDASQVDVTSLDASVPLVYLPRAGLLGVGAGGLVSTGGPQHASVLTGRDVGEADDSTAGIVPATGNLDTDKLWSVLANYLSLGQLELARTVMDQLFAAAPEKLVRALRDMVFTNIPSAWLFSRAVPSAGHLSWLAYIEYKKLYSRVYPDGSLGPGDAREEDLLRAHLDGDEEGAPLAAVGGQPGRTIQRSQLPAISNTPINPFGFITHDRITLTVIEVDGCKLPKECSAYHARLKLHDQTLQSSVVPVGHGTGAQTRAAAAGASTTTRLSHTFQTTVYYADSNMLIKIFACKPVHTPAANTNTTAQGSTASVRNEICVGEVSLPLHQVRSKNKFHIWLPLHAPSHASPALLHATGAGSGGQHSYGRVRLKLVWWKSGLVPAGDFSLKTRWLLETDLLMANAVINHRLAPGRKLLTPEIVEEMRAFARATWASQVTRQRTELLQQQERITKLAATASSGSTLGSLSLSGLGGFFGKTDKSVPGSTTTGEETEGVTQDFSGATWLGGELATGGLGLADEGPQLSDEVFRHLFRLIRSVPSVGHTLSAQLCLISAPDSDQQYFQHMYAQMIGEMVVRREYGRACEALVHVCKDIFACVQLAGAPSPSLSGSDVGAEHTGADSAAGLLTPALAMLDAIFLLFVVYIHRGAGATLERMAQDLMANRIGGLDANLAAGDDKDNAAGGLLGASHVASAAAGSLEGREMDGGMSDEAADVTFSLILDRKTKVYSALLAASGNSSLNMANLVPGTMRTTVAANGPAAPGARDAEQILKRFCLVEDSYLRALVDQMGQFPPFFEDLLGNHLEPETESEHEAAQQRLHGGREGDGSHGGSRTGPRGENGLKSSSGSTGGHGSTTGGPGFTTGGPGSTTGGTTGHGETGGETGGHGETGGPEGQGEYGEEEPGPTAQALLEEFLVLDFADDPTFLHAFWRYYSNYIRITSQHLFEFPIQVSLACIRLGQWNKVNLVLKPFSKLRPLVILLAWDAYEGDYAKRREIIIRIWRSHRLHVARELRVRRKLERALQDGLDGVEAIDAFRSKDDAAAGSVEEDDDDDEGGGNDDDDDEARAASEPKLINWCDRLDVFVLWIDTLLNIHPVLASLPRPAQESQASQLLLNLKQHSILYSFHTFLPSLAQPEKLLQLINPHESEELKHDYHIMRSFYAMRICLDVMKKDAARTEPPKDDALIVHRKEDTDAVSFKRFFGQHLQQLKIHIFSMTQSHFQVLTLEKIFSLLFISRRSWIKYERNLALNLEKILGRDGAEGELRPPDDGRGEEGEESTHKRAYFHLRGAIISELLHFLKDTITELMSSLQRAEDEQKAKDKANEHMYEPPPPPTAADLLAAELKLYPVASILSRLNFLKSKVIEGIWRLSITAGLMKIQDPSLGHLVSSLSSMSVFFLQRDQSLEAHLNPPFSAMDYCTAIAQPFLRQHAAAARIVADTVKWHKLCMTVQEMDLGGKRANVYDFILGFIESYHATPPRADADPDAPLPRASDSLPEEEPRLACLKHHQHLQSYFLFMDSSLTFAHLLTELEYVTLLERAIQHTNTCIARVTAAEAAEAAQRANELEFIQATVHATYTADSDDPSKAPGEAAIEEEEEEQEAVSLELLNFYTAYAKTRCLAVPPPLKSQKHEAYHAYSLDDANLCDTVSGSPGIGGLLPSESMRDEHRPFGFESSANSTYTRWMRMHGAADSTMTTGAAANDSVAVSTPYLQRYFAYLSSVSPSLPSQSTLLNPWVGSTGVRVVEYLALHTAHTRENTVPGAASVPHPPVSTFIDAATNKHSPSFNNFAYLALQILPALAAVRYVLRSSNNLTGGSAQEDSVPRSTNAVSPATLAAASGLDDYQTICLLARQHSQFNPAFHRWVNWRLSLYEQLYRFTSHAATIPFIFLSRSTGSGLADDGRPAIHSVEQMLLYAKDAFSRENVVSDQHAIMTLVEIYVDTFDSLDAILRRDAALAKDKARAKRQLQGGDDQEENKEDDDDAADAAGEDEFAGQPDAYRQFIFDTKVSVLEMCDAHLDHPSHHHCVSLVDRLLSSIITDSSCPHPLRSSLVLRVNDIVSASVWTLRYLAHWNDVHTCTDVLLKCLAGLSTLEISDQTKGRTIHDHRHRFDEFESSDDDEDDDEVDAGVSGRSGASGDASTAESKSKRSGSSQSKSLFNGPISELRSSIEFKYHVILIYKQLVELESTNSSAAIPPAGAAAPSKAQNLYPSWQSLESACNSNLTRVVIALIQHALVEIAQKLYVLYKTYSKLYPASAPQVRKGPATPEQLEREAFHKAQELLIDAHLTNQLESASLAALLSASSPTSDRIFAIKRLQALPKARLYEVGEGVLAYLDSSHSRYVIAQLLAQFLAKQHAERLERGGGDDSSSVMGSPTETNPHTAVPGSVASPSVASPSSSTSTLGSSQVVLTSMVGGTMSSQASAPLVRRRFYSTLSVEKERWFIQVHHATKMLVCLPEDLQLRYAAHYSDPLAILTELLKHGQHLFLKKVFPPFRAYCTLTATPDDAFFFVLNFASRLLTLGLEELALDKEVAFMVLDLCLEYGEHVKAAKMCLIMVEVLSSKLMHHAHPYLLLHLATAVLIYLGTRVLIGCNIADPSHLNLFTTYESYVRLCCGASVDTRAPVFSAAVGSGSKLKDAEGSSEGRPSPPAKTYRDVDSKLAAETALAEERLPLLYALVTTPLVPALSSSLPLSQLPSQSALLSRLLGDTFSIKDLARADKAALVRDQLLSCESKQLAKRVWKECEKRPGAEFEPYCRARARQQAQPQ